MSEKSFFSMPNFYNAIWALLVAMIVGVSSFIWGYFSGPETVIIKGISNDPVYVRVLPEVSSIADSEEAEPLKRQVPIVEANRTVKLQFNTPVVPEYKLPSNMMGYTRGSLVGFGEATCPSEEVVESDVVLLQMYIDQSVDVSGLTPAILQVNRPNDKGVTQVFSQQFELLNGFNHFRLPLMLPPGKYNLEVGFFVIQELDREYPKFRSVRCPLKVASRI